MSPQSPISQQSRRPGRPAGSRGVETRQNIIEIALECFRELGYERTSLTIVAEKSGLTRSAIYNYFDSKEELARAVLLELPTEGSVSLLGPRWWHVEMPERLSTIEKLKHLFHASVDEASKSTHESDFYIRVVKSSRNDPKLRETMRDYVQDQRATFSRILGEGVAAGELPADTDFEAALDAIQGLVWAFGIGVSVAPSDAIRKQAILGLDLVLEQSLPTHDAG
jgi:AcrR family transcriptional regulator